MFTLTVITYLPIDAPAPFSTAPPALLFFNDQVLPLSLLYSSQSNAGCRFLTFIKLPYAPIIPYFSAVNEAGTGYCFLFNALTELK